MVERGVLMKRQRVFLIVLDSFGIGHASDAADFGDEGANTLKSIAGSKEYDAPNMCRLGLACIDGVDEADAGRVSGGGVAKASAPIGTYGRFREASRGKDTTIGHWEIAGIISSKPLPTYPEGFPQEIIEAFAARTGRGVLCNKPYSGTEVIRDYGEEHVRTGDLIVYTSADSVFQVAAHEDVVPVAEMYRCCEAARELLTHEHSVGRVIARPFIGTYPNYKRTVNRHDFSLLPPRDTMLDVLLKAGYDTRGIGKIYDIFAGKGIACTERIEGNEDGMEKAVAMLEQDFSGLCFVNLVDFDMLYGHRNDVDGYARAVSVFDRQLKVFMDNMRADDILMITADHGCDPGYLGSDHTRECVPFLAYGAPIREGCNLGTRNTFADIAATILDIFGLPNVTDGISFKELMCR